VHHALSFRGIFDMRFTQADFIPATRQKLQSTEHRVSEKDTWPGNGDYQTKTFRGQAGGCHPRRVRPTDKNFIPMPTSRSIFRTPSIDPMFS